MVIFFSSVSITSIYQFYKLLKEVEVFKFCEEEDKSLINIIGT